MYHYIVVRADLPLGVKAANIAHAAGESSPGHLPNDTHVVVLQASGQELSKLVHTLALKGYPHAPVIEFDAPYTNQLMAVGISPLIERSLVYKLVSFLPLLKE